LPNRNSYSKVCAAAALADKTNAAATAIQKTRRMSLRMVAA
jgi:hypothetical protein